MRRFKRLAHNNKGHDLSDTLLCRTIGNDTFGQWLLLKPYGAKMPINFEWHPKTDTCQTLLEIKELINRIVIRGKCDLPWPPRVRKGILLIAIGTVPCLLWKWWTWWVVLRLDETLAETAGPGKASNDSDKTSLHKLAQNTLGGAEGGARGVSTNPLSKTTAPRGNGEGSGTSMPCLLIW